jgi:hypothetical protein
MTARTIYSQETKEILTQEILNAIHCVRFATARLTVGKDRSSDARPPTTKVQERERRLRVDILCRDVLVKGVIKAKGGVIQIFGNAVHLELGGMHPYVRIQASDRVVIIPIAFLLANGPFANTYAEAAISSKRVFVGGHVLRVISPPLPDQADKIHIARIASRHVRLMLLSPLFLALCRYQ